MKKLNKKIFARYFWDIANDQERKEVIDSKESNEMLIEQWNNYDEIKLITPKPYHSKITKNINQKIFKNIKQQKSKRIKASYLLKYAAVILTLFASAALVYFLIYSPVAMSSIAMIKKENPRGQRSELKLPDGSKLWLNADSKIVFPEKFNNQNRIVNLEGEAYFDVIKSEKPFIVKTNGIDIEVMGTEFNVKAYPNDNTITTTLVTGKVGVKRLNPETKKTQKAILTPNHQAIYHKNEDQFILDRVDVLTFTSWKQGKLIFDNAPIIDIINALERWYDIEIQLQKNLDYQYCYTLTITDESVNDVMKLIKKTTPGINITIHDNLIEISKN
ncbi:MAG: FecR family protein [Bacteroidales bacterium]